MFDVVSTSLAAHVHNEDAIRIVRHPQDRALLIVALADGQGGRAGGKEAANIACDTAVEQMASAKPANLMKPKVMTEAVKSSDQAVQSESLAGFTTLVIAAITPTFLAGASNGDSALAVQFPDGQWHFVTDGQPKNPPIGTNAANARPFTAKLEPGARIAVMSDGLWKYASRDVITQTPPHADASDTLERWVDAARLPNSQTLQDDLTVAIIDL